MDLPPIMDDAGLPAAFILTATAMFVALWLGVYGVVALVRTWRRRRRARAE